MLKSGTLEFSSFDGRLAEDDKGGIASREGDRRRELWVLVVVGKMAVLSEAFFQANSTAPSRWSQSMTFSGFCHSSSEM